MSATQTRVSTPGELVSALGPRPPDGRAAILIGGADATDPADLRAFEAFFATLASALVATGTTLVDGGTDSGVMRLIGTERERLGGPFRLVGVLPAGALDRPTRTGAPIRLAPGHSEFLLVPGSRFGEESRWLFAAADHLNGRPAPAIVVGGGDLTKAEAMERLDAGHMVSAVAGTGRTADALASDADLRASGRLRVIPRSVDTAGIVGALADVETPSGRGER